MAKARKLNGTAAVVTSSAERGKVILMGEPLQYGSLIPGHHPRTVFARMTPGQAVEIALALLDSAQRQGFKPVKRKEQS